MELHIHWLAKNAARIQSQSIRYSVLFKWIIKSILFLNLVDSLEVSHSKSALALRFASYASAFVTKR